MPKEQSFNERNLPWFQRACLLVRDMERSLTVYRDLLGFAVNYMGEDDADSYSYEIFRIPRSVKTRFATLSSEDQLRTLALIEVPGDGMETTTIPLSATVIQVASVSRMLSEAAAMGLAVCAAKTHPAPARGPGRIEAAIYDFDDHPVVIYQLIESGE